MDISKGDNRFAHHAFLESAARPIFERLAAEDFLAGMDAGALCARTAFYLGELNALHPFREGNGRTQREFIQLLARIACSEEWIIVALEEGEPRRVVAGFD